jgi:hypothetical protein
MTARLTGVVVAIACLGLTVAVVAAYPLPRLPLAALLALYGAALWRWPALWLAVLPAVLPAYDLTPWTGWMFATESDFFLLVTLGVLALRAPPQIGDFRLPGWGRAVLALMLASLSISVLRGLLLAGVPGGSSNPYLMPQNALRLFKGLAEAVVLLPFLQSRERSHGDVAARFAVGMGIGLVLVSLAALAERIAFVGAFNDTTDYRVVGPFSSMHVGGGHIGAYVAMALPFLAVALLRPRLAALAAMLPAAAGGAYTLVFSFARMAYGAAVVGLAVLALGWTIARRRGARGAASPLLPGLLFLLIGGCVGAVALGTTYMSDRVASVVPDLRFREDNWSTGLAMGDPGLLTTLFGMGLGTYPRVAFLRHEEGTDPSNFVLASIDGRRAVAITERSPFYFGQKISLGADPNLRLSLALRTGQKGAGVTAILCWKLLLYSDRCRSVGFTPRRLGVWEQFSAPLSAAGLAAGDARGPIAPPVDLAFAVSPDTTVALADIRLTDKSGRDLLVNGDFAAGTARWYFTDDNHWRWRIFNQYLMTLFEGGVLGLGALLLLAGTALWGAVSALRRGEAMGAAVAASLVAFLCSCLVDALLEAPRLATLFYLVCLIGLGMGRRADTERIAENAIRPDSVAGTFLNGRQLGGRSL